MSDALTSELLELERGFWSAATDRDFYRENVAEEAVFVFPYGVGTMDKDMVIYAIGANSEEWVSYDLTSAQAMSFGDDAAMVTYKAVAERAEDDAFKAFVSSAYVRRDGRWLLVFHQQTLASTGK